MTMNPQLAVALITAAYFISFVLPAAVFQRGTELETWWGAQCAMSSLFGAFILQFEGYANLLFPIALILASLKKWESASWMAAISALLASQTFTLFIVTFPANEGGVGPPYQLRILHIGFFLWYGSMLGLCALGNRMLTAPAAQEPRELQQQSDDHQATR